MIGAGSELGKPPTRISDISRPRIAAPVIGRQWVRRSHLETRLDDGARQRLTVICAPAGHGKTSTIASWLAIRGLDAAWITVNKRDQDLTYFGEAVALALDRLAPGVLAPLQALLTRPDRLPPLELGEAFGEALFDLDRDTLLVIDDVHEAGSSQVNTFLRGMVSGAPHRLHMILASRTPVGIPMARMRTRGEVLEITSADLRFTPEETLAFLAAETGEAIDQSAASRIQAAVGGWPAAMQLVALSGVALGTWEPAGLERRTAQLLSEYLGEEVLTRLPDAERDLLLMASLPERFNAPLLSALEEAEGRPALTSQLLETLRGLELFREIPGLSETWYAFHPIFREILLGELTRGRDAAAIERLHHVIATWFAANDMTLEAVQLLVQIKDNSGAAALIASRLSAAFAREDWQAVAQWLASIPVEEVSRQPDLLLASVWVHYLGGRSAKLAAVIHSVRDDAIWDVATEDQRAQVTMLSAFLGDFSGMIPAAENALRVLPRELRYQRGFAHLTLSMGLAAEGRKEEALRGSAEFIERESGRIDAASIRGYFARTMVLWQYGALARCEQSAADQYQLATMHELPVSANWGALMMAACALERGDYEETARHANAVIAHGDEAHFTTLRSAYAAQLMAWEVQGHRDEANRAGARIREMAIATESPLQVELVDSLMARVALLRGNVEAAREWLDASPFAVMSEDFQGIELPTLTQIKILLALGGADSLERADTLLREFQEIAVEQHGAIAILEGLAVQALLHEQRGEPAAAERALRSSLALAAPERITHRYVFLGSALLPVLRRVQDVEYAQVVLTAVEQLVATQQALTEPGAPASQPWDNVLSDRELQIVGLLAQRLTNNEIGEQLFISPITVKHHVANISRKLQVSGRRAIVDRCRELSLPMTLPANLR